MKLLLLISGNKKIILEMSKLNDDDFEIVKIDEKDLSRFTFISFLIKQKDYDEIWFGTIDADFQRFIFFINLFVMMSHNHVGGLIDENGKVIKFSTVDFIFSKTPLFIVETIASIFVAGYFYIKFPILKWMSSRSS